MRSRFLAVLAAVAFAAAPAAAQGFTLSGNAYSPPLTVSFNSHTYYSSPYLGSINGGSSFLVWCVDYSHEVAFGETYSSFWLTPLTGSLIHTREPGNLLGYEWAAWYASQMTSANPNNVDLQINMWNAVSSNAFFGAGFGGSPLTLGTSSLLTDPQNWALIDGAGNSADRQEFLVRIEGIGTRTDVVPEPVTMSLLATGLAGMALANRKRRRNTA